MPSVQNVATQTIHYTTCDPKSKEASSATIIVEAPVTITVNGITHAVMMVTPTELEAFATGFAFSENIIATLCDLRDINIHQEHTESLDFILISIEISPRRMQYYKQQKQARLGATGCGICGSESIEHAFPALAQLEKTEPLAQERLAELRETLRQQQKIAQEAGAIHGALLVNPFGEPVICMEDIGRHNALDKVIGFALKEKLNLHGYSLVTSSRCSTELVIKAVRAKLSCLIHLASPSTLAVSLARQYGLTLIHLTKHDGPRVYS